MNLVDRLKRRFFEYADCFFSQDPEVERAMQLKRDHTLRVCRNARMLSNKLGLSEHDSMIAEVSALFHDTGRFRQYRVYRTFRDSDSENHAALGVSEIEANSLLEGMDKEDRFLVLKAVEYHNALEVPEFMTERERFFLRLLRDADKLDILKVFGDYCEINGRSSTDSVSLGLPDTDEYSGSALDSVLSGRIVSLRDMQTLNDFKLLQVSWVYDINYAPAMEAIKEKCCIERLRSFLPQTEEIGEAFKIVRRYADRFIASSKQADVIEE